MSFGYASVKAKEHTAKGTAFHTFIAFFIGIFAVLFTILVTYGLALIGWLILGLVAGIIRKRAHARIHGSALKVGPNQFPQIFQSCERMSGQLGLKECPDVYIIEDSQQNAFALKQGARRYIVLIDDIVFGAENTNNEEALDFIIGHELAHHALGHTGAIRRFLSKSYRPLSRLDEFSCDSIAYALVNNKEAAKDALCLLLVGPQLYSRVNKQALDLQVSEVENNKYSKQAENSLTHPLLLRRYARMMQIN